MNWKVRCIYLASLKRFSNFNFKCPQTATNVWGWGVRKSEFLVEIQKSTWWRHLSSHKKSIDTKYKYIPVSWLTVGEGNTYGPPHFVILPNLYIVQDLYNAGFIYNSHFLQSVRFSSLLFLLLCVGDP